MTRVAIIGGGIGGLTAANALSRAGIEVTVYEAAAELREIGEPQGKNRRRQEEGAGAVVVFKVDRIARQTRPGVQNQPKRPRLGGP